MERQPSGFKRFQRFQRMNPRFMNKMFGFLSDEREEELAYLVHSHWKEDVGDQGRS